MMERNGFPALPSQDCHGRSRRPHPHRRRPQELRAAQAQSARAQARRHVAAVRRLSPRSARSSRTAASRWARITPFAPASRTAPSPASFRRTGTGVGYVRPHFIEGQSGAEIRIHEEDARDAATGDTVLVRITRKPNRPDLNPIGKIIRVLERATRNFVGTYFERDGQGLVPRRWHRVQPQHLRRRSRRQGSEAGR